MIPFTSSTNAKMSIVNDLTTLKTRCSGCATSGGIWPPRLLLGRSPRCRVVSSAVSGRRAGVRHDVHELETVERQAAGHASDAFVSSS
jgi:hypothetical protein